eukprot:CAMPEP_0182918356 /NCGR_PEP_ID=MMETSP0105_2-20130417/2046_1 /TAXON_ID=81532 ORGANISM="Acanthoeca-like sp., Strain 10tr" /NCGR_SAMPLE_ID=MMETSP0105_2 /ASSEMBLY_ACC=CAM_ASM_000205 /LENGTH=448 /DNA_ID=CAMNT_0025055439 /DNA_START=18 /DNA_END=1364 /DNA_ORIENTATION=-
MAARVGLKCTVPGGWSQSLVPAAWSEDGVVSTTPGRWISECIDTPPSLKHRTMAAFNAVRSLGRRVDLKIPVVGVGGAGFMLGGKDPVASRSQIGFRVPTDAEAGRTQQACWDAGMRFWDTSPWYGRGQSEHRVGRFLYDVEPRDSFLLSTKVGRRLVRPRNMAHTVASPPTDPVFPQLAGWAWSQAAGGTPKSLKFDHIHDYSYDGIMRSYEDSMQRLGMNTIDVLVIHDLDLMHMTPPQAESHLTVLTTSGIHALEELKGSGDIKAFGAGINHVGWMTMLMSRLDLDFFLASQVYSLLHHWNDPTLGPATTYCDTSVEGGALAELDLVLSRGIGVIAATTFNAGILARGVTDDAVCNYRPATETEKERVRGLEDVCAEHGVPLQAAAIRFSLSHPAVASLVTGFGSADEVNQFAEWLDAAIPDELWAAMKEKGYIHPDAPTTNSPV